MDETQLDKGTSGGHKSNLRALEVVVRFTLPPQLERRDKDVKRKNERRPRGPAVGDGSAASARLLSLSGSRQAQARVLPGTAVDAHQALHGVLSKNRHSHHVLPYWSRYVYGHSESAQACYEKPPGA